MRMLLAEHRDGATWVPSFREDLTTAPAVPLALFYTRAEADAYITAMCGLIHCGGDPRDFRVVDVEFTGEYYACTCQAYGKSGVPWPSGKCMVCGLHVNPALPVSQ